MKKLAIALMMVLFVVAVAFAEPFLTCDPQEGAENYKLTFAALELTINSPATAEGALMYDMATWTGPGGWHAGEAVACDSYAVEDTVTGTITEAERCSEPSPFRMKIPKLETPSGYKLQ